MVENGRKICRFRILSQAFNFDKYACTYTIHHEKILCFLNKGSN